MSGFVGWMAMALTRPLTGCVTPKVWPFERGAGPIAVHVALLTDAALTPAVTIARPGMFACAPDVEAAFRLAPAFFAELPSRRSIWRIALPRALGSKGFPRSMPRSRLICSARRER